MHTKQQTRLARTHRTFYAMCVCVCVCNVEWVCIWIMCMYQRFLHKLIGFVFFCFSFSISFVTIGQCSAMRMPTIIRARFYSICKTVSFFISRFQLFKIRCSGISLILQMSTISVFLYGNEIFSIRIHSNDHEMKLKLWARENGETVSVEKEWNLITNTIVNSNNISSCHLYR